MDMQNVSNLQITEGAVRTIHDKDGKLLWGRLAYDTKYAGDTFQQTYSGKNIIDNTDLTFDHSNVPSSYTTLTTLPTGIRYKTTYSSAGSPALTFKLPVDLSQYVGKTVRIKANFGAKGVIRIVRVNDTLTTRTPIINTNISGETISWTVTNDLGDVKWLAYSLVISEPGGEVTVDFTDLIMTIDNSDMSYEPYTGGIASPNPDFPEPIDVVTGEQMVEVHGKNLFDKNDIALGSNWNGSVGTICYPFSSSATRGVILVPVKPNTNYSLTLLNSEWYIMQLLEADSSYKVTTVSADSYNEGAKSIATRSDTAYIGIKFKYGSAGTTTLVSSLLNELRLQLEQGSATTYESYQYQTYTVDLGSTELCKIGTYQDYIYKSGDDWYVHKATGNVVLDGSDDEGWQTTGYNRVRTSSIFGLLYNSGSSYGYYANQLINANSETVENSFNVGASAIFLKCTSKTSSVANWKTWLSSNNLIIYAPLATATDTQITDSSMIGQLNAVHQWLTRYGYNATVTGNLPLIIDKTNL